ncbi:hypothetical protein GOD70_22245 [Sinorhizobium medicae]|nr:hypothetical protein [Sinorhizobium medicae]
MRFAFSLLLTAIGVSFLLPSDGYKAALFILCAGTVALFMPEPQSGMNSVVSDGNYTPKNYVDDNEGDSEQDYPEQEDDTQYLR